jgi:putative endonuclease
MSFYVYIVANKRNGTIYVGMTDDLSGRIWQHKSKARPGFTARYGCDQLV